LIVHPPSDFIPARRREFCRIAGMLALLLAIAGCKGGGVASSTKAFPEETGFVRRQIKVDGETKVVWVFVPPGYKGDRMYPAILFLHGLFEQGNGTGGTNVLGAGLGPIIARNPKKWPFITIFPQSDGNWKGDDRARLAIAALNDAESHYMIDPSRVILAGLSYGGLGVWEIGAKHRDRFAALVPVSGMSAIEVIDKLNTVPIWAFASKGDIFVDSENSAEMCRNVQAHGGRARLTEFPGNDHDCWALAVDQTPLVRWMLGQRKDIRAASTSGGRRLSGQLRSINDP